MELKHYRGQWFRFKSDEEIKQAKRDIMYAWRNKPNQSWSNLL